MLYYCTENYEKEIVKSSRWCGPRILPQGAIQASSRKARDYQGTIGQFLTSCRRHAKVGPPLHLNQDSHRREKKRYYGLFKIIPCAHHCLDHFRRRGIVSLSPTSFIIVVFLMLRYSFLAHETNPIFGVSGLSVNFATRGNDLLSCILQELWRQAI